MKIVDTVESQEEEMQTQPKILILGLLVLKPEFYLWNVVEDMLGVHHIHRMLGVHHIHRPFENQKINQTQSS